MRLLFVHAHPSPDSFTAACRDAAIAAARAHGHETKLIDLYAENFQPSLRPDEWLSLPDPDAIDESLTPHIEALQWAEGLIFTHPTWWGGPPAILKGWLDRTLRPGIAVHIHGKTMRPRPAKHPPARCPHQPWRDLAAIQPAARSPRQTSIPARAAPLPPPKL